MKKTISLFLVLSLLAVLLAGCGDKSGKADDEGDQETEAGKIKIGMVADRQQVTADPFQYGLWKGLVRFKNNKEGIRVKYLESKSQEDFLLNFDQLAQEGHQLIIGAGFILADAAREAAEIDKEANFVLLDHTFAEEELRDNLTGIDFASEISAFLAGYIAGNVTESGKIGFVGGVSSAPLNRFEYGYRYGALYAAAELEKEVCVDVRYTDTFEDRPAGNSIASEMYDDNCDVIFQAAGECGLGVIEAAKLKGRWVIGADADQYEEAPDNILTSALKRADKATEKVAGAFIEGEAIGGKNYMYGLNEDAVGIPEKNPNLTRSYPGLYERTMELEEKIKTGEIPVPADEASFAAATGEA